MNLTTILIGVIVLLVLVAGCLAAAVLMTMRRIDEHQTDIDEIREALIVTRAETMPAPATVPYAWPSR